MLYLRLGDLLSPDGSIYLGDRFEVEDERRGNS